MFDQATTGMITEEVDDLKLANINLRPCRSCTQDAVPDTYLSLVVTVAVSE